jgi:catechol 2,3-dioxygenase-like lactoylglutathione lyase family enzyme
MRFLHTNIIARDWKSLSRFYIDVFGCSVRPPERNLSGQWVDDATGVNSAEIQGVHLNLPGYDADGPTLEIFSYSQMHQREPGMANSTGLAHIAFEVESVDQSLYLALKNGGLPLGRVTTREVPGAGILTFVYFRDPEGNIVEILSWKK